MIDRERVLGGGPHILGETRFGLATHVPQGCRGGGVIISALRAPSGDRGLKIHNDPPSSAQHGEPSRVISRESSRPGLSYLPALLASSTRVRGSASCPCHDTFGRGHGSVLFSHPPSLLRTGQLRFDECHGGGTGYAAARRKAKATERLAAALHRGSARMASELPTGAHVERMQCAPALPQPARQASGDAGGV